MTSTLGQYPFPVGPGGHPPEQYHDLRGRCPVARVGLPSGDEAWFVTGYEEAAAALSDRSLSRAALREPGAPRLIKGEDFSDNPYNLLNQEGPDHSRLRRLLTPAFTPRQAERLRPRIQELADELVDELVADGPPADLHERFASVFPVRVICEMVGAPDSDRERIQEWTDALVSTADEPERRMAAREGSAAYVATLVAERVENPKDDLLGNLVAARDENNDRLGERELVWLGVNLLVAGHDTSVSAISRGLFSLLAHREQFRRLQEDPSISANAVEELLRFAPPSEGGFVRVATADTTVGDVAVRAGEAVIPAMHVAGRDEREVADPDTLDVTRDDAKHLAFGKGPHYCPGAGVARVELQVAFETLSRRLPDLHLVKEPEEIGWRNGLLTLRPEGLICAW